MSDEKLRDLERRMICGDQIAGALFRDCLATLGRLDGPIAVFPMDPIQELEVARAKNQVIEEEASGGITYWNWPNGLTVMFDGIYSEASLSVRRTTAAYCLNMWARQSQPQQSIPLFTLPGLMEDNHSFRLRAMGPMGIQPDPRSMIQFPEWS